MCVRSHGVSIFNSLSAELKTRQNARYTQTSCGRSENTSSEPQGANVVSINVVLVDTEREHQWSPVCVCSITQLHTCSLCLWIYAASHAPDSPLLQVNYSYFHHTRTHTASVFSLCLKNCTSLPHQSSLHTVHHITHALKLPQFIWACVQPCNNVNTHIQYMLCCWCSLCAGWLLMHRVRWNKHCKDDKR